MGFKIHFLIRPGVKYLKALHLFCNLLSTPMAKIRGNEIRRIRGLISLMKSDNPERLSLMRQVMVLFSIKIQWVGYEVDTMMDEIYVLNDPWYPLVYMDT